MTKKSDEFREFWIIIFGDDKWQVQSVKPSASDDNYFIDNHGRKHTIKEVIKVIEFEALEQERKKSAKLVEELLGNYRLTLTHMNCISAIEDNQKRVAKASELIAWARRRNKLL